MKPTYKNIAQHYEECLDKHGDSHLGVDWPKLEDAHKRYRIMLEIISYRNMAGENVSLLDFGCGAAHLLDFMKASGDEYSKIGYSGLDISSKFISLCKEKYPANSFYCADVLVDDFNQQFDFIVMNGVFTEKRELSFDEMLKYFKEMLLKTYPLAKKGIAFNVMSKSVDWERDDLFHLPLDTLSDFLCREVTRNFIVRNDYGLYEYTVYVYK